MELKLYNMVFHLWCIMYVNFSVTMFGLGSFDCIFVLVERESYFTF